MIVKRSFVVMSDIHDKSKPLIVLDRVSGETRSFPPSYKTKVLRHNSVNWFALIHSWEEGEVIDA